MTEPQPAPPPDETVEDVDNDPVPEEPEEPEEPIWQKERNEHHQ